MDLILYILVSILTLAALFGLWYALPPGPRPRRDYARPQRLLEQGQWREAAAIIEPQRKKTGQSSEWQQRWQKAAGESQQLAVDQALKDKRFEEALRYAVTAASLLGVPEID